MVSVLSAISQPNPVQPPGTESFATILNWAMWGVTGVAVLGMLITAGLMAISHRQGMGNEHMGRLGWIFGGLILAGSAALLVNMVMG